MAATVLLASLKGCFSDSNQFIVSGHIEGAHDTLLVLEHLPLNGRPVVIDSLRLGDDGFFTLSGDAPKTPEFYRLRIGGQAST